MNFFECSVKYTDSEGKTVKELYGVEAYSFTEAEAVIIDEMSPYVHDGSFEVVSIKKVPYENVLFSTNESDDKFYKVKVTFVSVSEVTAKETKTTTSCLVQAGSIHDADAKINEYYNSTMLDYFSTEIKETKILEFFQNASNVGTAGE